MKRALLVFYLLFLIQILSGQNIVETYYSGCMWGSSTFELFENNTFIQKSITHSCTFEGEDSLSNITTSEIKGTYKLQGDYLSLQPKSESYKPYNERIPIILKNGIMNRNQFITKYYMLDFKGTKYLIANMDPIYYTSLGKRYNGFIVTANGLNARDSKDIIRGSSWQNKDCSYVGNIKNA